MASLDDIFQHLINIKQPKIKDYWDHLDVILKFVDEHIYESDDLIYSMDREIENGFNVKLYFNKPPEELTLWPKEKVIKVINNVSDVFSKFFLIRQNILKQSVFLEIKALVSFFTDRIKNDENIKSDEKMTVSNQKLFLQCEAYEYMYTYFDKLNYIFLHLNEKYITKTTSLSAPMEVRFHVDFEKNVLPFVKDEESKQIIKKVVQKVTSSTVWHFIRKLRNSVAHDFIDPTLTYNLNLEIKLLYINICRIVFLLDATIMKDDEIYKLIQALRDE